MRAATGWQDRAACQGQDWGLFFGPFSGGAEARGKAICQTCMVRPQCLSYALDAGIRDGTWGGMTEDERDRYRRSGMRRQPQQAAAS